MTRWILCTGALAFPMHLLQGTSTESQLLHNYPRLRRFYVVRFKWPGSFSQALPWHTVSQIARCVWSVHWNWLKLFTFPGCFWSADGRIPAETMAERKHWLSECIAPPGGCAKTSLVTQNFFTFLELAHLLRHSLIYRHDGWHHIPADDMEKYFWAVLSSSDRVNGPGWRQLQTRHEETIRNIEPAFPNCTYTYGSRRWTSFICLR